MAKHMAKGATYTYNDKWRDVIANEPHCYAHSMPVAHVYDVTPFAICHFAEIKCTVLL